MKLASRLCASAAAIGTILSFGLGLFASAPAHAVTVPVLSLSDVADLTPGQSISSTVTDVSGVLCDASYGVGEWNVYLAWYRTGLGTPVGYSVAQSSQSGAFIAGASTTISADFYVVWLEHDPTQSDASTWDGTYTAVAGCMTAGFGVGDIADGEGANHTGTPSAPVDVTYKPVAVSESEIVQGGSLSITMTDASQRWCSFTTGPGFSMGVWFYADSPGATTFAVPADFSHGGVAGAGDFTWSNSSATVEISVPSDAPPGDYLLAVSCVGPSPTFLVGPRGAMFGPVTVTAADPGPGPGPTPPLPETGRDADSAISLGVLGASILSIGLGTRLFVVRRRRVGV